METTPVVRSITIEPSVGPLNLAPIKGTLTLYDANKEAEVLAKVRENLYRDLPELGGRQPGSSRIYTKWGMFQY